MELLEAKAGQLAYILPHKFFNSQYGEPLRQIIAGRYEWREKMLRHVVHFGDQQIWYGYIYPKALDVMPLPKLFTPDIAP